MASKGIGTIRQCGFFGVGKTSLKDVVTLGVGFKGSYTEQVSGQSTLGSGRRVLAWAG